MKNDREYQLFSKIGRSPYFEQDLSQFAIVAYNA